MTDQKSAAEVRLELEEYIAVVGLRVAVETAVAICQDPKATAAARAAATNSLLRAGALGGFARNYDPIDDGKELHEMSAIEVQRRLERLKLERDAREADSANKPVNAAKDETVVNLEPVSASAFD